MTTFRLAGVEVPRVGLGTNRLTPAHVDFVREAVAEGVRHIDTAHLYSGGDSERAIGEGLARGRGDGPVATQGGSPPGGGRAGGVDAQNQPSPRPPGPHVVGPDYPHPPAP